MNTNRYLAAILKVFSDSADFTLFLPLVCRQILTADSDSLISIANLLA